MSDVETLRYQIREAIAVEPVGLNPREDDDYIRGYLDAMDRVRAALRRKPA